MMSSDKTSQTESKASDQEDDDDRLLSQRRREIQTMVSRAVIAYLVLFITL